jgi:hypothetical protein
MTELKSIAILLLKIILGLGCGVIMSHYFGLYAFILIPIPFILFEKHRTKNDNML